MTDQPHTPDQPRTTDQPRRRAIQPPSPRRTATVAVAVFLAVLTLLAWQVRTGRDPALSAARPSVVVPAPQNVLERRIVRRVVIERVVGDDGARVPVQVAVVRSVPTTTSVHATPPAAAPAPAPGSLVTRTS